MIVVDASTFINLVNGEILETVLSIPGVRFLIGSVVRDESRTIKLALDAAISSGRLGRIDDSLIDAAQFVETRIRLKLDEGETECILAARTLGCAIACDDFAARRAARSEIPPIELTGSIGLLKKATAAKLISPREAHTAYRLMRQRGGFLPFVEEGYFSD